MGERTWQYTGGPPSDAGYQLRTLRLGSAELPFELLSSSAATCCCTKITSAEFCSLAACLPEPCRIHHKVVTISMLRGDHAMMDDVTRSMSYEHSKIGYLTNRWNEEDATRDELEEQRKRNFLEQEANQLFEPIENHLRKLGTVLYTVEASVHVDFTWTHLGERKLRRVGKVMFRGAAQLPLDFTIEGASIIYRNTRYPFGGAIGTLIPLITSDVEQFIDEQGQAVSSGREHSGE
jgi:hypothetical protein